MVLIDNVTNYWKMDDSSGDIIDSHGSDDGTYNGALYSQAGKIETSIGFDGINDTVNTGITTLATTHSINLWFKRGTKDSEDRIIVSKWGPNSINRWAIRLESGTFDLQVNAGSDSTWRDIETISDTDWHMLTFVISSTEYSVYLDNVLKIDGQSSSYENNTGGILFFGAFDNPLRYFEGELDEAGLFDNYSLDLTDVDNLWASSNGFPYPFTSKIEEIDTTTISDSLTITRSSRMIIALDDTTTISDNLTISRNAKIFNLDLDDTTSISDLALIGPTFIQSTPIDFNNGIITTATLSATYTGNTPIFFMTANGSNFEEVTNNTPHTFANSGTSLAWAARSDGTTITQLNITDYH